MQRSSIRFVRGLSGRSSASQLLVVRPNIACSQKLGFAKDSGEKTALESRSGNTMSSAAALKRDMTVPRRMVREDNMWTDPQYMDTRWLRPRDPRRYKPDFAQTEPHSLRIQFMRSPDERTRNAMGRDWEALKRVAEGRRRQSISANLKQEQNFVNMGSNKELGHPQK
ncbi:uncharacterized protein LOC111598435 [Drosophila hydei]|uniref:Uncharacterized protein LOC111598435 n=1 Tax=Drosophila hydei TaxID=7224 RepID=A0A6J1LZ68_DROHY|nr:uncharacterized protein LOC111598435 [Drosophila hydei]